MNTFDFENESFIPPCYYDKVIISDLKICIFYKTKSSLKVILLLLLFYLMLKKNNNN
jgi:hypothetical protein